MTCVDRPNDVLVNGALTATVSGPDGTSVTCEEDDPCHYASMSLPTDTVELPRAQSLPDGAPLTAVITAGRAGGAFAIDDRCGCGQEDSSACRLVS